MPMRFKLGPKMLLPLAIALVGIGVFALLQATEETPEKLRPTTRAPVVSVQAVTMVAASPTLRLFGQVETPSMSVLTAGVEADVVALEALEGEAVRRGRVIVLMDDADAELAVRERNADLAEIDAQLGSEQTRLRADRSALAAEQALLELARTAVARAQRLLQSNAGSKAELDRAREDEQSRLLALAQRRRAVDDFDSRQQQL
ncbi:MAG: efflux RND transporter periplasmic adaptor subunit, partial [bacterium]